MVAPGYMPTDTPLKPPPAPPPREGAQRVDFDQLAAFDYDPEADYVPDEVMALDGKVVELIGVMYYGVEDPRKVTGFYMMPNHMICCYGTWRYNEVVEVRLRPRLVTQYVLNYYLVRGKLSIRAIRDEEGNFLVLYRIDDAEVEVLE